MLFCFIYSDDSDEDVDWLPEKSNKRLASSSANQKKKDRSAPSHNKAEDKENVKTVSQGNEVEIPVCSYILLTCLHHAKYNLFGYQYLYSNVQNGQRLIQLAKIN